MQLNDLQFFDKFDYVITNCAQCYVHELYIPAIYLGAIPEYFCTIVTNLDGLILCSFTKDTLISPNKALEDYIANIYRTRIVSGPNKS